MGQRGPSKTPTKLIEMRGNPGHRPINTLEPQGFTFTDSPECPDELDPLAQKYWDRLAENFANLGVLQDADLPALQKLAFECGQLETIQKMWLKTGTLIKNSKTGIPQVNPLFKPMMELSTSVSRGLQQFGGMPSARPGLHADTPARKEKTIMEMIG